MSLRRKTTTAQNLPRDLVDKTAAFHRQIIRLRRSYNYEAYRIGNMDETAIYLDMPGDSTLDETGTRSVLIRTTGHNKDKVTVMLAALGDGTKIAPLMIFKGVRPPKNIVNGVVVAMSRNGWNNEEITKVWLEKCWGRLRNSLPPMLVWDSFKSHVMASIRESVRSHYNTHMVVIPGGCTGVLQPADVSWNKPFKAAYREKYEDWAINGEVNLTASGRRRAPSKDLIMQWVKEAWQAVTPDVVRRSFKKCGFTNHMDGTEDDQLFNSDVDDDESDPFSDIPIQGSSVPSASAPIQLDTEEDTELETAEEDPDSTDEYETGPILTCSLILCCCVLLPIIVNNYCFRACAM